MTTELQFTRKKLGRSDTCCPLAMSSEDNKETALGSAGVVKFEVMPKTLANPFREHFTYYTEGLARGEPFGFVLTPEYAKHAEQLRNFQVRSDDVWIVTYPKCGNVIHFKISNKHQK